MPHARYVPRQFRPIRSAHLCTSGALLRSRGRVIDALDIDEIATAGGVKVTPRGVDGRLQAILRAHEMRWAIVLILMAWRMIFSLMLVAGGGAISKEVRHARPLGYCRTGRTA